MTLTLEYKPNGTFAHTGETHPAKLDLFSATVFPKWSLSISHVLISFKAHWGKVLGEYNK